MRQIAEREGGRLNQEVTRFMNEMAELNERRRIHEVTFSLVFQSIFMIKVLNFCYRMKYFWPTSNSSR
jgi:hypothetical protein